MATTTPVGGSPDYAAVNEQIRELNGKKGAIECLGRKLTDDERAEVSSLAREIDALYQQLPKSPKEDPAQQPPMTQYQAKTIENGSDDVGGIHPLCTVM